MKDPRKTILISGIICLVIAILASVNIYLDIVRSLPIYLIVYDAISIIISFGIGIYMIVVSRLDLEKLIKQQKVFLVLTFIAIFGSFITFLITFYTNFVLSSFLQYRVIYRKQANTDVIDIENVTIQDKADYLAKEIAKLEKKKEKGEISEEEFLKLKSELINKFL